MSFLVHMTTNVKFGEGHNWKKVWKGTELEKLKIPNFLCKVALLTS